MASDPEREAFERVLTDRLTLRVDRDGTIVLVTAHPTTPGMMELGFHRLDADAVMDALAAAKAAREALRRPRCLVEALNVVDAGPTWRFNEGWAPAFGWRCLTHGTGVEAAAWADPDAAIAAGRVQCPRLSAATTLG